MEEKSIPMLGKRMRLRLKRIKSVVLRLSQIERFISMVQSMTVATHCAIYAKRQVLNAPAFVLLIQPFGQLAQRNFICLRQIGIRVNLQFFACHFLINMGKEVGIFG